MQLNQITLPSTDVARSCAFFSALGFTQIVSNLPNYARFECADGGSTFSLHRVDSGAPGAGIVVYFECDDVDALYRRLVAQGVEFDSAPADQTWLWREAYLRDPDGHVLCLYHAGENRRNPPWRIGSARS